MAVKAEIDEAAIVPTGITWPQGVPLPRTGEVWGRFGLRARAHHDTEEGRKIVRAMASAMGRPVVDEVVAELHEYESVVATTREGEEVFLSPRTAVTTTSRRRRTVT